eukprot:CAMPEP_0178424422 /NCGR_PEP_ID=MMETSP0689_2-20121128/28200_1 /TAXON_ID=160604 /ORGANISM="Amphidinium massartii, Strain CS-259" /LENGTH=107 /DNA_ID=CAMNT_0020046055 /DNA_START=8 /DNA_END=327 /DNA_ORIENTATION=+
MSGRWKNLSLSQKVVYSSAVVNVVAVGLVFVRRQFKLVEREQEEEKEYAETKAEIDSGDWSKTSKFRCYFAAGLYKEMSATPTFEEELKQHTPEVKKVLDILAECKA